MSVLRLQFTSQTRLVSESMVAGTVAGELTFISRTPRNATVTAELATTVWMLDQASLEKLEQEQPREAIKFVKVLMKVSKEEHDSEFSPSASSVLTCELTLAELFFFCSSHLEPRHCPFMSKPPQPLQGKLPRLYRNTLTTASLRTFLFLVSLSVSQ